MIQEPNATLLERIELSDSVARIRISPDLPIPAWEPGQYMTLGVVRAGGIVRRPYSMASAPGGPGEIEFLVRRVEGGALTPLLWQMPIGGRLALGRPKGLFTLLPGDRRTHLFVATGTGLAPLGAMLEGLLGAPEAPPAIVLHGGPRPSELAYQKRLAGWISAGHRVMYVPVVSRPDEARAARWGGRIGRVDGVLRSILAGSMIAPERTVAYLCGNPGMITGVTRLLTAWGLPADGIRSEEYWPAAVAA